MSRSEKENKVRIGIDLGGTAIKIGLLNQEYQIIGQTAISTNADRPYQQVIADMGQAAAALLKTNGYRIEDCLGVGIGSPGTIDSENGIVLYSNNIRWNHVPLARELQRYLPLPVYINNDANCAALGETESGAAKGCQNVIFLTLGTGVGGGIVINGTIFEGGHPGGAELGHMRLRSEGRKCTCGREDCLEAYASATALIADTKEMAKQHPESFLWKLCEQDLEKINAKTPFDAAEAGDYCGQILIENYIQYLADGIANLVNIFRPDLVVLGGGVCAQGEKLTEPLNQYLRKYCFGADVAYIPQVVTAKNGNDAGIIGAAKLVKTNPKEILFLDPVCTENIWGGTRLREEFHYANASDHTGECWGISAHPNGNGTIKNGRYSGTTLSVLWEKHPELFGNLKEDRFPLLAKIIDAKKDLSIQVHPDDSYAKVYENGSYGKTECWYVIDCEKSSSLVIGHHAETKEELHRMIEEKRWNDFIREIPIQKGDFIQIDPGTVHAIKGGCLILETQQNSDITYRIYDYDRLSNGKPRELHIQKSLDVIKVPAKRAEDSILSAREVPKNQLYQLYQCDYYKIFKLDVEGEVWLEQNEPFLMLSVLEGSGIIENDLIKKGDHFIIPYQYGRFQIKGKVCLIVSTVGEREKEEKK